jgi:serine protease Do
MWTAVVYTSVVLAAVQAPPPDSTPTRTVVIGGSVTGSVGKGDALTRDSTYVQSWTLSAEKGQTVTIDLSSTEFDAYVMLRGPGIQGTRDYWDDDSGGLCNARLTVTFPQTGDYEIIVNTAGKLETGAFTLTVASGSKPKSLTRCNRDR